MSAQARTAIDELLTTRLGEPQGLLSLALKVRQAAVDPVLSSRLFAELKTAITAAVANDQVGMQAAVTRFTALVEAGPIDPAVAAELLAAGGVFAVGPRTIEAESAELVSGACRRTDHTGYTGTGFVACLKTKASGVRFVAPVAAAGLYSVRLRYANGSARPRR